MFAFMSNLPMDGAVALALASMIVSFTVSLYGLLHSASLNSARRDRHHG